MPHIAYITTEYPHSDLPSAGGVGSFVKLMGTSLIEKNWQVTIFLALREENKIWFDGGIRIVEIKKATPSVLSSFKDRYTISKVVKQHIKKDKIGLIEAPDWEGFHAFCNFKIPLVTRIHGSVTYFNFLQSTPQSKLITFFEKRALKRSNFVVAVSLFSGNLTQKIFKLPDFKFEVIYNGVDIRKFQSVNKKEKHKEINILYFGTLVRKKGVLELAHIFNELIQLNSGVKLTIVGKDTIDNITKLSTWESIKKILHKDALDHVYYKGVVSYEDMSLIIKEANVCVFPSFAEAFPISWLEAMSMSKPIVASSIGWAKEAIINKESGLLEHPQNHKEYALKINQILLNPDVANSLGENARKRVEDKFGQQEIIKKNIVVYKKLMSNE